MQKECRATGQAGRCTVCACWLGCSGAASVLVGILSACGNGEMRASMMVGIVGVEPFECTEGDQAVGDEHRRQRL